MEEALQDIGIPVFHDDQHGTAIVVRAAIINAAKVVKKEVSDLTIVISGAGAAGVAITKLLSGSVHNIIVTDSKGIISINRTDLNSTKQELLNTINSGDISGNLEDALNGADVFIGVSKAGIVTKEMIKSMKEDSIVLAMANPVPEIMPDIAKSAGAAIVGTGRSDFPNQVNNPDIKRSPGKGFTYPPHKRITRGACSVYRKK